MISKLNRKQARINRKVRIRARIFGTLERPRLVIFKSNNALYTQFIDDAKGEVIGSVSELGNSIKSAGRLAIAMTEVAKKKKITKAVFDRSGYQFHGVVKVYADKMREGGLTI